MRLVIDSAPASLAHLDMERRFKFVNQTFARRYARPIPDIIGRTVKEVIGDDTYRRCIKYLDEAFAGQHVEFEMEDASSVGRGFVRINFTPDLRDGQPNGVLALVTDITAGKEAEREIARARDQALAASRAKDEFIAALSHELRTPLNPVLLIASESAENVLLPAEVRRDFATIRKSVELEARLIDDLLDVTRIITGKLPLDRRVVDVESVLQDALSVIHSDVAGKRIVLSEELRTPNTAVNADPARLQQVFWNVLKNAVKFTPPGGKITVRTGYQEEGGQWCVTFEDTGIGMTEAEMSRVFNVFTQGEHAVGGNYHRFGGVGLGLTISRMLVELQGGTVHASSPGPGRGSAFTITIPAVVAAIPNSAPTAVPITVGPTGLAPTESSNGTSGRRVLVVEDHSPTREALASLLRRRNFEVLTAGSVAEARERVMLGNIALVVSDIGLPDGDGCDLMAELRENHGLRGIALTGYGREADVARSAQAGFIAHLTKPVRVQALDAALASAWKSEQLTANVR